MSSNSVRHCVAGGKYVDQSDMVCKACTRCTAYHGDVDDSGRHTLNMAALYSSTDVRDHN